MAKRMLAILVAAVSSIGGAHAAPELYLSVFAVTGVESLDSCKTPAALPDQPLSAGTPDGRARLAALFGGTGVDLLGTDFKTGAGSVQSDMFLRLGGTRLYVGVRGYGDDAVLQSGGLAIQNLDRANRLANETFPLGEKASIWIAHSVPGEKHACLVLNLSTAKLPDLYASPQVAEGSFSRPLIVAGNVVPPVLKKSAQPVYPFEARKEHREGQAILRGTIDRKGVPQFLVVLRYPPGDDLAVAALDAASKWTYEPARLDGKPVQVFFTIMITFKMDR